MSETKMLTLVMVYSRTHILLGMKKRGFGEGRWNGFGGKVEPGETIVEAAKRELLEESFLTAKDLELAGILMFEFVGDPVLLKVHVFKTNQYEGSPAESEEMRPKWFAHGDIPYDDMWPDDKVWLPLMLQDKKFTAYFKFEGHDKILDSNLKLEEQLSLSSNCSLIS